MTTNGSSAYGIVAAGCRLLPSAPGAKLSFDRGLHIAAIAEVLVASTVRAWLLTIDETRTPDVTYSYLPQVTNLGAAAPNGDTVGSDLVVPFVHRVAVAPGASQRYLVFLRTPTTTPAAGAGLIAGWPAYGALRAAIGPENAAPIAPGAAIAFAFTEALEGNVTTSGAGGLSLPVAGRWLIEAQFTIAGPGQAVVAFGGAEIPGTRVGRDSISATGPDDVDTQIVLSTIIDTGAPGVVTIQNPAANAAYTLTPNAGGVASTHATFKATFLPAVPGGPPPGPAPTGLALVDPLISLVGNEGFSFTLVSSGLDSGTAP